MSVVLTVALVSVGLIGGAPAASAVTVDTGTWYVLVNRNSGKALDVYGMATNDGARIAQWTRNDGAWQQWQFVDSGNGYYRLRSRHSGKVLDVPGYSTTNGTGILQWSDLNGTNQQFRLEESTGGYVRLINRNSNKAVGVAQSSTADGADVVQWTDLNLADQQWRLLPVDTPAPVTVDTQTWYVLVNRNSGKALDDYDLGISDGARVVQWARNDGPWQQWQFIDSGGGYYRLRNQHSNKVLDVYNWSTADGAAVVQWRDRDGANQQFRVVESAGGYMRLINRNSGKALEVYNWSTADGADVKQWSDLDGAHQQWQLVPVGSAAYPDPGFVTGDTSTHDPSVVRRPDGGYLMAQTGTSADTPLLLKTSTDRVQWTDAGSVFPDGAPWADPYTDPETRLLWAPDLAYRNGVYYMYYSASTAGSNRSAIFLATSATGTAGSWVHRGLVIETFTSDDFNAIDPNLLVDDQGRWWLSFGSYFSGIKMIRLDAATGMRLDGNILTIANRNPDGIPDPYFGRIEAPFIVKRGSYYYLYVSFDSCCAGAQSDYRVMVGRSTSPTGPYVDRYGVPMLEGGGTEILAGHGNVNGPGHQAVLADTDGDILVYHYYPDTSDGEDLCFNCTLGINRIGYDPQGWPYVY